MINEKRSKGMQRLVECSAFIAILNKLRNNGNISQKEYEEIRNKINKKCWKKILFVLKKKCFYYIIIYNISVWKRHRRREHGRSTNNRESQWKNWQK